MIFNAIRKTDTVGRIEEVLRYHDIGMPRGWEMALGMLFGQCDYLEVHDFGPDAYFTLKNDGDDQEVRNE